MALNQSTLTSPIAYPQAVIPQRVQWANSWYTTAHSWFWWFGFILLGSLSHSLDIYMPWVAFAVLAGITLQRHKAIAATLSLWLFHDGLVGGIHNSEASFMTLGLWGCCMGLALFIVTGISTLRPQFAQQSFAGHWQWIAISMGIGFLIFEGMIAVFWNLFGGYGLDLATFSTLFSQEILWAIALGLAHWMITRLLTQSNRRKSENPCQNRIVLF